MRSDPVRFESVCSRDVDMLVLEELTVSPHFRSWLLETLDLPIESATMGDAWYSAIDGEPANSDRARSRTDVEFGLEIDGERVLVVLATVLDTEAPALRSDGELERYRTRRERALATEWDECRMLLIAPAVATATAAGDGDAPSAFDATVSLESIGEWFAGRETDRGDYRAALVAAAIDRGRDGRANAPRTGAGDRQSTLVRAYQSTVTDLEPNLELSLAPDIEMPSDDAAADPRATVAIEGPSLAPDHLLVHDLRRGTVDLRIPGAAPHIESFAARYAAMLSPATNLLTAGDALVLRRSVPATETDTASTAGERTGTSSETMGQHADAVETALEAVRDLLELSDRIQERSA